MALDDAPDDDTCYTHGASTKAVLMMKDGCHASYSFLETSVATKAALLCRRPPPMHRSRLAGRVQHPPAVTEQWTYCGAQDNSTSEVPRGKPEVVL